jgi:hypothetical protein
MWQNRREGGSSVSSGSPETEVHGSADYRDPTAIIAYQFESFGTAISILSITDGHPHATGGPSFASGHTY